MRINKQGPKPTSGDLTESGGALSLLSHVCNSRDTTYKPSFIENVGTRFIISTSKIYERLISKAGFAVGDRQKGVTAENIEA